MDRLDYRQRQQRIAVVKKFKKKIREQAKVTQGTRTDLTSSPNGEKVKNTRTDKELARLANVGTGTIARFNRVVPSGDEDYPQYRCAKFGTTENIVGDKNNSLYRIM